MTVQEQPGQVRHENREGEMERSKTSMRQTPFSCLPICNGGEVRVIPLSVCLPLPFPRNQRAF